jgi:hypothetical protein
MKAGALETGLRLGVYFTYLGGMIMRVVLIILGLLVTTGVVYAACLFC